MNGSTNSTLRRPRVGLIGEYEHPDFSDAVALLRASAELTSPADVRICPELIIIAQSRPGVVGGAAIDRARRMAPLASAVSLLGSWCEGQARGNRPIDDTLRVYWYEFASWWRRQLALRAAGRCPDWARPESVGYQSPSFRTPRSAVRTPLPASLGVIALSAARWDTADALADAMQRAGYAAVWQPPGRDVPSVRGTTAGIWEGGQLDDREAEDLAAFCQQLAADSAPVVALLDFPRRDRCATARQFGAATVVGKPWNNAELVATIGALTPAIRPTRAA